MGTNIGVSRYPISSMKHVPYLETQCRYSMVLDIEVLVPPQELIWSLIRNMYLVMVFLLIFGCNALSFNWIMRYSNCYLYTHLPLSFGLRGGKGAITPSKTRISVSLITRGAKKPTSSLDLALSIGGVEIVIAEACEVSSAGDWCKVCWWELELVERSGDLLVSMAVVSPAGDSSCISASVAEISCVFAVSDVATWAPGLTVSSMI